MLETLYVPYKSLKQKQKARIADGMYRETLRFYLEHQRMPEAEELEQLCQSVYIKIRSGNYRVVYEEIRTLYEKRLEKYALRVQRDVEAGVTLEAFSKQPKQKKTGKARRLKKIKKREHEELEAWQDDRFFFIAGYTSGGAPYGITWEEMCVELSQNQSQENWDDEVDA